MPKQKLSPASLFHIKLATSTTLNPAAHLYETESKTYSNAKLIRSSFSTRWKDTDSFLDGEFFVDPSTNNVVGKPGLLDYIIPHHFIYRAWQEWKKSPIRFWGGLFITIPLAILSAALYLVKKTISFPIKLLSLPILGIVNAYYNKQYRESKAAILSLAISRNDPTKPDESAENIDVQTYLAEAKKESTYKKLFSNQSHKTELVEDAEHNLYIKVSNAVPSAPIGGLMGDVANAMVDLGNALVDEFATNNAFYIQVTPQNNALRHALQLNVFGITGALERKKNEQGQSDLARVEEALAVVPLL